MSPLVPLGLEEGLIGSYSGYPDTQDHLTYWKHSLLSEHYLLYLILYNILMNINQIISQIIKCNCDTSCKGWMWCSLRVYKSIYVLFWGIMENILAGVFFKLRLRRSIYEKCWLVKIWYVKTIISLKYLKLEGLYSLEEGWEYWGE